MIGAVAQFDRIEKELFVGRVASKFRVDRGAFVPERSQQIRRHALELPMQGKEHESSDHIC